MQAAQIQAYVSEPTLYTAIELSAKSWKLRFSNGSRDRQGSVAARDLKGLLEAIAMAKSKLKLDADCRVVSCYEAGRDGFWLHRWLVSEGVENVVVDPSSLEVSQRKRRAKTDRIDACRLVDALIRQDLGIGHRKAFKGVRVPSEAHEARRLLERERGRLIKERNALTNRMGSQLMLHGIELKVDRHFLAELKKVRQFHGSSLAEELIVELERAHQRYELILKQIGEVEEEQQRRSTDDSEEAEQVKRLMLLKSIGCQRGWGLINEGLMWREFANSKEIGGYLGMSPTPWQSGDMNREQGITKSGNRRLRTLMIELAWHWLRWQPDSALSQWYRERFDTTKRQRRVGIVALARKLAIALWRYLKDGAVPYGAVLKS